jgi:hypothetical protein
MKLDGVLRQRDRNQKGEFLDVANYSISRDEWNALEPLSRPESKD